MGHCNDSVVGVAQHTDTKMRSETGENHNLTVVNWEHNVIIVHMYCMRK